MTFLSTNEVICPNQLNNRLLYIKKKVRYKTAKKMHKSSWSTIGFGHSFDRVLMRSDIHDWDTWYFSDSPLQILITSADNVHSMLLDSFYNAVIGVGSFMVTFKSLKSGIFGNFQSYSVLDSELFEFRNDTVGNVWDALTQETIH